MAISQKGIDIRQTGTSIQFRVFLQTSAGALLGTGTTVISIQELQSDATIKSYDFNDNTFKTTALTTPTLAMTHRPSNNAGTTTGIWTVSLGTVSGFTAGAIYFVIVNNTLASPTDQCREFQYGGAEGDLLVTAGSTGQAYIDADTIKIGGTTQTARDIGASVLLSSGSGTGQILLSSGVVSANTTQFAGQTITCGAGVTILASVGTASTSTAQTGDSFARIGAAGAGLTAITGVTLASTAFDAILIESGIAASSSLVNDASAQLTSINARQALALIQSACAAIIAGASGTTITIAATAKSATNRITATVDSSGDRSAITLTVPT